MEKLTSLLSRAEILEKHDEAESYIQHRNYSEAYKLLSEIEPICSKHYDIFPNIIWNYTNAVSQLELACREKEQFEESLTYCFEALRLIEKGKPVFDEKFASREYFMTKNIITSYFGLGQLDKAKKYRDILYAAYQAKKLPKGMDEHYNFSFFKSGDKNVWGYEWYEELPAVRFGRSFSKVVYYVYSTKEDGTDNELLYSLHVLMFHKLDDSTEFDYVLTKRFKKEGRDASATFYDYTYNKDIDFSKLESDVRKYVAK